MIIKLDDICEDQRGAPNGVAPTGSSTTHHQFMDDAKCIRERSQRAHDEMQNSIHSDLGKLKITRFDDRELPRIECKFTRREMEFIQKQRLETITKAKLEDIL